MDTLADVSRVSGGRHVAETRRKHEIDIVLEGEGPAGEVVSPARLDLARRVVTNPQAIRPDVCFLFSRAGNRRLYSHRSFLAASSPYFATLFSSGFSESCTNRTEVAQQAQQQDSLAADDMDDAETDMLEVADEVLAEQEAYADAPAFPGHTIVVTSAAYTTYRAVLLYFQTTFAASLASSTAASKLTTSTSLKNDEIRQAVINFILAHFEAVEDSEARTSLTRRIRLSELPGAAPVLMDPLDGHRKMVKTSGAKVIPPP
ncbi:hypothetical protein JCM11641_004800 [Rhodosporidiobolus odoratus]